jgi:hypothetical protein
MIFQSRELDYLSILPGICGCSVSRQVVEGGGIVGVDVSTVHPLHVVVGVEKGGGQVTGHHGGN